MGRPGILVPSCMAPISPRLARDSVVQVTTDSARAGEPDYLVPLDVISVGSLAIVPDVHRPVAAVVADGQVTRWLTWPSAPLPERAVDEAEAWPTEEGVWIIYRSDGVDDVVRTAVYVDVEHVGAMVELRDRRPVAVDRSGLWLADPRDASAWMSGERSGVAAADEDAADDEDEELESLLAAELPFVDDGPFWPDPESWKEPAVDDNVDDADRPAEHLGEDIDDEGTVVATEYQWSIGFADDDPAWEHDASVPDLGDPGPPALTPPTDLIRIASEGTPTTIRVDHLVDGVSIDGTAMRVRFHPTGPRHVPDGNGAWDIVYEPHDVVVDITTGLPTAITTEALESVLVAADADADADAYAAEDEWERVIEEREARRAPWIDRLLLDGVDGTRWPLQDADAVPRERSTARLVDQFAHLADPNIIWMRGVDGPRRIRSAYRDVRVDVEGEWPDTAVMVSFEHTAVPFLRLRRSYRVFDDTGHPVDHGHVTVYLDEDLDTGHIPPRRDAVDGILNI